MAGPQQASTQASTLGSRIAAIQAALTEAELDGWLFAVFQGNDPVSLDLLGLAAKGMITRRCYYLIPASGEPRKLVHDLEPAMLDHLPGGKSGYRTWQEYRRELEQLLRDCRRLAAQYSPNNELPNVSRLDAGTAELLASFGVKLHSAADLVQQFAAVWSAEQLAGHEKASVGLYRVKDRALAFVRAALAAGRAFTEFDVQQEMVQAFRDEDLWSDSAPVVGTQGNAGNPHYLPTATAHRAVGRDEVLLLDLWGKLPSPGSVFADITWMAFTGARVPDRVQAAWKAAAGARDAAIAFVQDGIAAGRTVRGFEVDATAREVLIGAGFAAHVLHRTGHSLGQEIHGNGVHMDDYETHDDRRLVPGLGFTIEPGLYFDDFGIRTEINMTVGLRQATVTGDIQREMETLA
jgi:Xaa-Pro aminopeptidase